MLETEICVTAEVAAEHGLTAEEYGRILKILGRGPNLTELGIFSVMWSEHCSYKSSKVHLKRLPTTGERVVQGPGENAGVVDIGDGLVAVFKIESHNHPSFVEPFQGAATGVGGILRDIFTMGARPIAVLNSLRFGPIDEPAERGRQDADGTKEEVARNRRIVDGVVRGIAHYGNCFGVPTVGGEVMFEPCYTPNPLVNALALGIARRDELFFARARGVGNPVIYTGAKTGRDGIHGASLLASAEFTEESQQKRPNVQVGDPFMEKLLLEACLEAMHSGAVVAIQDMGAAGLTCSTCEMASRGGVGIEIELQRVPQRETGMTPYEIMLSESQERMLLVAERGREQEVLRIFAKWGLDAVEIGTVTEGGMLRVRHHGQTVAEIPAHPLAEEGPVYSRPLTKPGAVHPSPILPFAPEGTDLSGSFEKLLASPAIASKRWVYQQYDHMVQTNTMQYPGAADAAVIRVKGTQRALALSTDCNSRWCRLDPREGAKGAVAEAARNVACTGARPVAATNCLNFGSPEKPEVMWQFSEAIDGLAEACAALGTPVTGGNVSFYNETLGQSIYPTPTIGILGVLQDASRAVGMAFRAGGDAIVLLDGAGAASLRTEEGGVEALVQDEFASSEYAKSVLGIVGGVPPAVDLAAEKRLIECLVALTGEGAIASAHDVSDGGLAVTLAECCFTAQASDQQSPRRLGAEVGITESGGKPPHSTMVLFGERGARAVVSCAREGLAQVLAVAARYNVGAQHIGAVSNASGFALAVNGRVLIHGDIGTFHGAWASAIERALTK
jgi:phosphoribosylformylglycinamidine synthase